MAKTPFVTSTDRWAYSSLDSRTPPLPKSFNGLTIITNFSYLHSAATKLNKEKGNTQTLLTKISFRYFWPMGSSSIWRYVYSTTFEKCFSIICVCNKSLPVARVSAKKHSFLANSCGKSEDLFRIIWTFFTNRQFFYKILAQKALRAPGFFVKLSFFQYSSLNIFPGLDIFCKQSSENPRKL